LKNCFITFAADENLIANKILVTSPD
jgi:hypothetical protein